MQHLAERTEEQFEEPTAQQLAGQLDEPTVPTEEQLAEEREQHRIALWHAALDDLETRALRAIDAPDAVAEWAPHPSLGPVPAELVTQLARVLETYRRAIVRLTADRAEIAAELRASSRAATLAPAPAAVFLDVRG